MLVEKAWAKVKGGYASAEQGQPENALSALLGVPVFRYQTIELVAADIFTMILEADELDYPMTATTGSEENAVGLPPGRTFSILHAFAL